MIFLKKVKIMKTYKEYKDFLPINIFCKILFKIIKKRVHGTFNVSFGKKVYLTNVVSWLNYYNNSESKYINKQKEDNNESFTLSNNKLFRKIKLKANLKDLKRECKILSRIYFNKKHAK